MPAIDYKLVIGFDENEVRLELPHYRVCKYEAVSNTLAVATELKRCIRRKA
jgi:hypothetical protein